MSTVLQQRGTYQVPDVSAHNPKSLLQLVRRPVWLAAFGVMVVGWTLQAVALDKGRVAVVQALLTMSLVFVLPLGVWLTGQRIAKREVVAAFFVVVGLWVFANVGSPATGRTNAPSAQWVIATLIVIVVCAIALYVGDRGSLAQRAAANGTVSGATAGLLAVMSKPVLSELSQGLGVVLSDPKTYMVALLAVVGIVFQQFGLATGKLAPTVASGSVASPIVAVVLGAAILEEHLAQGHGRWIIAVVGLAVALTAAVVITLTPHDEKSAPGAEPVGSPGV
jgi:drug/metabolite transporter (DMT)-like permease